MTLCFSNHTSQPLDSTIIAQALEAAGELVSIPHEVYAIFEIQPLFANKNLFQQHHSIQCGAVYRAEIDGAGNSMLANYTESSWECPGRHQFLRSVALHSIKSLACSDSDSLIKGALGKQFFWP